MELKIKIKGYEENDLIHDYAERRLGFALSRFSSHISSITLKLYDENGPRGGSDQKCEIVVRLQQGRRLSADGLETSWQKAIDTAADRMDRLVARHVDSQKALRFQSGMVPKEKGL